MTESSPGIKGKFVLGTAQFGLDYGITNIRGKPSKGKVLDILSLAWEKSIRRFDTAPGYGSEKLLGEFISVNGLQDEAILMTKIPSLEGISDYQQRIRMSLESSLTNLGCPVDVLFLHNPLLLSDQQFFETLINDYPVNSVGVSVYDPQEVESLAGYPIDLAFQFPINVLDRRFEQVNMNRGKRYARSIFLQGILASEDGLIEDAHKSLLDIQRSYHLILSENNIDPINFALSFVTYANNVDYFLVGVETVDQLNEILSAKTYKYSEINNFGYFQSNFNTKWLDPRNWK